MVGHAFPEAPQKGGPRVSYACGVWHDSARALKPAYRDLAATSFRSTVRAVDFRTMPEEAREEINSWVAEATNNLINSIVGRGSVNSSTRLVLANAIYFKGSWAKPFHKSRTKEDKFHRLDGSVVDAQFMNSGCSRQYIGVHDGFKVLRMPYAAPPDLPRTVPPRYSMCVLLPDEHSGLQSLQDKVASSPGFLQDHMPESRVRIGEFRLPKFKLSFDTSARKALQDLGVQAAFSPGAELRDMLEDEGSQELLYLQDMLHKAVIEVNEEGTVAAAASAGLECAAARPRSPPPDFVADHPFAFFVVEEVSGGILFAGHVLDPTRP
nr:unnamed protein product [Digitaria exilis]